MTTPAYLHTPQDDHTNNTLYKQTRHTAYNQQQENTTHITLKTTDNNIQDGHAAVKKCGSDETSQLWSYAPDSGLILNQNGSRLIQEGAVSVRSVSVPEFLKRIIGSVVWFGSEICCFRGALRRALFERDPERPAPYLERSATPDHILGEPLA